MNVLYIGDVAVQLALVRVQELNHAWSLATMSTIEGVPKKQFIGPDGTSMRLPVRAHYLLGVQPMETRRQLKALGDSGRTFAVQVSGTGEILGWFVMTSMREERKYTLPDGTPVYIDFSLTLQPDRPPEGSDETQPAAVDVDPQYEHEPTPVDIDRDPDDVSTDEIVRR